MPAEAKRKTAARILALLHRRPLLRRISHLLYWAYIGLPAGLQYGVIRRVMRDRLTYLGARELILLGDTVRSVESRNILGIFVEAGCALGGSAIVIASLKNRLRPFYVYDAFGMIPPPSERDRSDAHERYKDIMERRAVGIGDNKYYGYEEDLLGTVRATFKRHGLPSEGYNVTFVKGLYHDTLHIREPVAFAHIDCDWYDSVHACLAAIAPNLSVGGIMIVDDYYAWSGCRDAVHDYFKDKSYEFEFKYDERLIIKRIHADTAQRKSIALWGASGFHNMGDEAMLAGNLETIKGLLGDKVQSVVLSYNPEVTSQLHQVPSTHDLFWLMNNKGKARIRIVRALKLCVLAAKLVWNAKRVKGGKPPRFLDPDEERFLLTLANSEALIIAGAGNINDIMVRGGLIARTFTSYLAKVLSKPVFVGAQTVGPLNSRWTRWLAKKFLESADVVTLRETFSATLVKDIGVKHENLYVAVDDAFNIEPIESKDAEILLLNEGVKLEELKSNGHKVIGFIPRAWWERERNSMRLRAALEDIIRFLIGQEKYYIVFVSTSFNPIAPGDDDAKTALEIVGSIGGSKAENYKILTGHYNWRQLKGILGLMDFTIGASYHSIVFAVSMGVPTVGLYADEYYRLKIAGFFDLLNLGDLAIDANKERSKQLIDKLGQCLEKEEVLREYLEKKIAEIKASSCSAAKRLANNLATKGL